MKARLFSSVAQARAAAGPHLAGATAVDLFQTWNWFENLERFGLPAEMQPRAVLVEDGGTLGGLCLPLAVCQQNAVALYGPAVVSLSTYYTSLYGPVGAQEAFTVQACREAVRCVRAVGSAADIIDLRPLDLESPFADVICRALRAEGYVVDRYFCFGNWHLPCSDETFAQYQATLPSRVRNTVQRHRKKLEKNGPWSIEVHQDPGPALEEAIAQFNHVYSRSWKVPEPFPEFVTGLCRTAAREGWLRLGVLKIGDVAAASQLWLVHERKALIYKLAYDDALSQFSPGSVLSAEMFQLALDVDRVTDVDYLTGDDGYKRDWMRQRRERFGFVAFRRTSLRAQASLIRHRLGRSLRYWRASREATQEGGWARREQHPPPDLR